MNHPLPLPAKKKTLSDTKRKLELSYGLFEAAFEIKKHQLKLRFPEKSDRDLNLLTMACFEKGTK